MTMERITGNKNVLAAAAVSLFMHAAVVVLLLAVTSNPVPRLLEGGDAGCIVVSLVTGEIGKGDERLAASPPPQKLTASPREEKRLAPAEEQRPAIERRQPVPVRLAMLQNPGRGENPPSAAVSYPSHSRGIEGLSVHAVNGSAGGANREGVSGDRNISTAVPKYRENAHPRYPMLARSRGEEGVVLISAEVLANGRVGKLGIRRTSGYRLLDQSALEAVKNWKFEPARKMGLPVAVWVEIPVRFALRDSDG
jgi:protein TonB